MHLWERQRESRAGVAIVSGLAPVAVGLVCATALLLARAADRDLRLALVTVVAGGVSIVTRLNPLWLLAGAAALGLAGAFG
jgi:chromate transporter